MGEAGIVVQVLGHAPVLRLLEELEALPQDREIRLELGGLRSLRGVRR
ncbi:hypothetical protein ABZT02_36930 [Streptomyces sp. NPDC005402]